MGSALWTRDSDWAWGHTFILPDVLQGEGQAGILPLDDPDFAEGSSADDS